MAKLSEEQIRNKALALFMKDSQAKQRMYHGTGNLEELTSFDPKMTGKGNDQLGSGFYFTTHPEEASGYTDSITPNVKEGTQKLGGNNSPGVVAAHLAIKKPIKIGPKGNSLNDAKINLSHEQVKQIIGHAPKLFDPNESPISNHHDTSNGVTPKMIHDVSKLYMGNQLHSLENDMFPKSPTDYRHALHKVTGHDGVVKDFGDGRKHYVAWFPEQIKSAIGNRGTYDATNPDITMYKGGSVKSSKSIAQMANELANRPLVKVTKKPSTTLYARPKRYADGGNVKTTEQMKQELRRFKNGGSNVVTNQPGYLESTPTKPNPLVGTRYKTKTVGRSLKENPYDIAQAKDAVIVGAPWDATSRGEQVTEVSGNPIKRKIVTSGGQGYARDVENAKKGIVGASNSGIANRIIGRFTGAQQENLEAGGNDRVLMLPTSMGAGGEHFSTDPSDVAMDLLQQKIANGQITRKELDKMSEHTRKQPLPKVDVKTGARMTSYPAKNFIGYHDPRAYEQIMKGGHGLDSPPGELRKAIMKTMMLDTTQKKLGFNYKDLIGSVTDPEILKSPKGYMGRTVVEAFPEMGTAPSEHPAYDTDIMGEYLGRAPNAPIEIYQPDVYTQGEARALAKIYKKPQTPSQLRTAVISSMEKRKSNIGQRVNDRVINNVGNFGYGVEKDLFDPNNLDSVLKYYAQTQNSPNNPKGYADGGKVSQDGMEAALAMRKPKKMFSTIDEAASSLKRGKGTGAEFLSEVMKHPSAAREMTARGLKEVGSMPQMTKEEFLQHLKDRPVNQVVQSTQGEPMHEQYQLPGGKNYKELLLELQSHKGQPFMHESHLGDVPNVIAHMRVSDRTGPNGEKVLHAEEIQSDWHQKGSKHGYNTPETQSQYQAAKKHAADMQKEADMAKVRMQMAENAKTSNLYKMGTPEDRARIDKAYETYRDQRLDFIPKVMKADKAHDELKQKLDNGVPDAPFKKDWHELALKHLMKHAVEGGYDKLAVTQGKEQVKRWQDERLIPFYDEKIPGAMNKLGKQFGSQVHNLPIQNAESSTGNNQKAALRSEIADLHAMDITPEMRKHVNETGLPLYADGGEVNIQTVGVNEAPDMDIKEYVRPEAGAPSGGVPQIAELMQPPEAVQPPEMMQPPVPPPSMGKGSVGQTPGQGSAPMGMPPGSMPPDATKPPPQSNILQMTQQGQALAALKPPQALKAGGKVTMPNMDAMQFMLQNAKRFKKAK